MPKQGLKLRPGAIPIVSVLFPFCFFVFGGGEAGSDAVLLVLLLVK